MKFVAILEDPSIPHLEVGMQVDVFLRMEVTNIESRNFHNAWMIENHSESRMHFARSEPRAIAFGSFIEEIESPIGKTQSFVRRGNVTVMLDFSNYSSFECGEIMRGTLFADTDSYNPIKSQVKVEAIRYQSNLLGENFGDMIEVSKYPFSGRLEDQINPKVYLTLSTIDEFSQTDAVG